MASSHNVTNEKPNDFEDTTYDPDIEARLYAEIYYSNETYAEDFKSAGSNETASVVDNVTSPSSPKTSSTNVIDVNPAQSKENNLPTDHFTQGQREGLSEIGQFNFAKPFYPTKNWIFGEAPPKLCNPLRYSDSRRKYPTRQRLLAHEGLWSTPEVTQDSNRPTGSLEKSVSESQPERPEATRDHNETTGSAEISVAERLPVTPETSGVKYQTIDKRSNNHRHEESQRKATKLKKILRIRERREKEKRKKTSGHISKKAFPSTRKIRRNQDGLNNVGVTTETSKYNVVAKKKKLKMRETSQESVEISSDSDDSILEVPIPPKAPPPVIQLPDSDDESGKTCANKISSGTRQDKINHCSRGRNEESTPCYSIETDSSDESVVEPTRESSPLSLNEINEEAAGQNASINQEGTQNNFESVPNEADNLIINCTDIQRGASSLEEIRKIREGISSYGYSDDSMTESEAANWVNIAAKQANTTRDGENLTIEKHNLSLWDQLMSDNSTRDETTNEKLLNFRNETNILKNCSNPSTNNDDTLTRRKRHEAGESSTSGEFSVPEIPEKRTKRKIAKASADKSLSEYFFKPMSKEMLSFYNNPWGGENLDLFDIQSRMPRNPSRWTILDSDLRGPMPKKHRACPRCKTDSHYGKRCPEKPKPPCCSMCGANGHTETRCPETMCLTCGNKYATYRPTCGYCSKLFCDMCHGTGHVSENCPDLWRRYHNTTTETLPVEPSDRDNVMKAPQYLSCCNCAKRGHDVTMCRQLRWSQHFTTPMYVSSYTDGPVYPPSLREHIQATNQPKLIDLEDVLDNCDPPHAEFHNLASQGRLILEYGKFDNSSFARERTISKHLDQLKNVHLSGLLSGDLGPKFLETWQENFIFNVKITHGPDDIVLLVMQANTNDQLNCLDDILMQWLTRRDNEKEYLVYDKLPYNDIPKMMIELKAKLVLLGKLLHPALLMKKIAAIKEVGRNAIGKDRRYGVKQKSRKLREKIERQCQLVASLFKRSLVEGAERMVPSFRARVRELEVKPEIAVEHYMEIVYLYNEIFTYRESEALTRALEKVIPNSLPLEPPFDNNDQDNRKFENSQIQNTNNFYIDCSPTTSNFFPVDDRPGSSAMMVNIAGIQNYNFIPPLMSSESLSLGNFHLQKSQPTFLLNHYGKKNKRRSEKEKPANDGLLINLTKKKRKIIRRLARKAINLANSSCLTHLQKIAHDLKMKLNNNSVRTEDVQLLRRMLVNKVKNQKAIRRHQSSKFRNAKKDGAQLYKKLCESL